MTVFRHTFESKLFSWKLWRESESHNLVCQIDYSDKSSTHVQGQPRLNMFGKCSFVQCCFSQCQLFNGGLGRSDGPALQHRRSSAFCFHSEMGLSLPSFKTKLTTTLWHWSTTFWRFNFCFLSQIKKKTYFVCCFFFSFFLNFFIQQLRLMWNHEQTFILVSFVLIKVLFFFYYYFY